MKVFAKLLKVIVISSALAFPVYAKTVRYELNIENKKVNITGREVDFALTVNGGIPAPTLEFTEGDDAEIVLTNKLADEEVSLHWHGILLPPEEDGVPYVNTPPIFPGKSRTFKFRLRQSGTYWYHSHTMLQEQKGVYGAIIIHPKKEMIKADKEAVVILSDWSNENADQIIKNLKKDGDYYLYKKNSVRSIFGAAKAGELKTYFANEWNGMGGMDLSDVGYDAFLINGKMDSQLLVAHPGERIRLRIINAGSSSYFYVSLGQSPMQIISADGVDIEPVQTNELLIGMAETYDVLFIVPEHKNFELRATAQDVTGSASGWIGTGPKVYASKKAPPDLYAPMDHGGHTSEHSSDHVAIDPHAGHKMPMTISTPSEPIIPTLGVDDIKAFAPTTLPQKAPVYEVKLVLGGDMERYVWHINGKAIHENRLLMINQGDVVRFIFENTTMMHHPMHLHGHFFRVLNQHGERSPLKHTVDVPPMGARTIEFFANEPGQWMLHCHNLYHMDAGMARVVRYNTYKQTAAQEHLDHQDHHLHQPWYHSGALQVATNIIEGNFRLSQTWNEISLRGEARSEDEKWGGDGDLFYQRWVNNNLNFILGGAAVEHDYRAVAGVGYALPMLIDSQLLVDHKGKLRVDLEKRFQWTSTFFSETACTWRQDPELDSEVTVSLMYGDNWSWAAGVRYTGHSIGAGLQYQF